MYRYIDIDIGTDISIYTYMYVCECVYGYVDTWIYGNMDNGKRKRIQRVARKLIH